MYPTLIIDEPHNKSPPGYMCPSRLERKTIENADELKTMARAKSTLRIFLLRQRNSYSRVQVSQELFECLLQRCHVFPKFRDYMVGFGHKDKEQEIGPPPLAFRPLLGKQLSHPSTHLHHAIHDGLGQADKTLLATVGEESSSILVGVDDSQELHQIEDQLIDVLNKGEGSPSISARGLDTVVLALEGMAREIPYTRKKTEGLISKVRASKSMISNLLDRQSAHALRTIESETQKESSAMRVLAEKGHQDSSSTRVLSVITLIYLPSTIVLLVKIVAAV
ncbi:hypothetical protein DL771_010403 [Monosporascus sp. 5C6A]|nr:hypothetical protein DL771_010403 [Monosporascus sp. 5C6A]